MAGLYQMDIIETTLLRGKVRLLQPKIGFHASTDTVFLGAAAYVPGRGKLLDAGCGVGSAGFCALARAGANVTLTGIDLQPGLIDLALQNAALNGLTARCRFFADDIRHAATISDNAFDSVIINPPYLQAGAHTPSPNAIKAAAHGESADLEGWVRFAHRKLKAGGHLTMIHRADRLDDVILSLEKRRWFGSLTVFPLFSHAGEAAKRVIIRARKERYARMTLMAGMVLHATGGAYTQAAEAVLSKGKALIE